MLAPRAGPPASLIRPGRKCDRARWSRFPGKRALWEQSVGLSETAEPMNSGWGERVVDVSPSQRIVVYLREQPVEPVILSAIRIKKDASVVLEEDHVASRPEGAAILFGRSNATGLAALAIDPGRLATDVDRVVVRVRATGSGPVGRVAAAIRVGGLDLVLPVAADPRSTSIELMELSRSGTGWAILTLGAVEPPPAPRAADTSPLAPVDAADGRAREKRPRASSHRVAALVVLAALVAGATWTVPRFWNRSAAPADRSIVLTNLDGTPMSTPAAVSLAGPASDIPEGLTPVGPVYNVTRSLDDGPVIVRMRVPRGADAATLVVGRNSGNGWEILGGWPTADGRIAAVIDHFSLVTTFLSQGWQEIVRIAGEAKRVLGLGAFGDSPRCDDSNPRATATVTAQFVGGASSEKDFRVEACTERVAGQARVRLANRRAVAVRIVAPDASLVERTIPGVGDLVSVGLSGLAKAVGGPDEGALIPPGGLMVLDFDDAPNEFRMSIDNSGIAWSVLFAVAGGVPGGWAVLNRVATAIDAGFATMNAVSGRGWEDLARLGLGEFFRELASAAQGPIRVAVNLASAAATTVILAVRGTVDGFAGLAGTAFATLVYVPGRGGPSVDGGWTGPVTCALAQRATRAMQPADRDAIGRLPKALVGRDPSDPAGLSIMGLPRDSVSGDAYEYRWKPGGQLQLRVFDYRFNDFAVVLTSNRTGEFTCEPYVAPTTTSTTRNLTTTTAASRASGESIELTHPSFGPGRLRWVALTEYTSVIRFTDSTAQTRWESPRLGFLHKGFERDGAGNYFVLHGSGGPNSRVVVLRPTAEGFADFNSLPKSSGAGEVFASRESSWGDILGSDGIFEIINTDSDCVPNCAAGTRTRTVYKWTGAGYERVSS